MKSCPNLNLVKIGWMALLLATGTVNIIGIKFMDVQTVTSPDGVSKKFNHPFLQTWSSYFGGTGILIAYFLYKATLRLTPKTRDPLPESKTGDKMSIWLFLPPGILDLASTALIFVALILTHPSSCMMLRGVVIIFTAFLSKFFLGRKISIHKLVGIVIILLGLGLVGLTDLIWAEPESPKDDDVITTLQADVTEQTTLVKHHASSEVLLGDFLVIFSQILVAIQYVYEEKYISKYSFPVALAVGLEALFALIIMSILLIPFYFIKVGEKFAANQRGVLEDSLEGFKHLGESPKLLAALIIVFISIGFYNLAGLNITRISSATTRVVMDSVRTVVIWILSISFSWQIFRWLHLIGFITYLLGMLVYHLDKLDYNARRESPKRKAELFDSDRNLI